VFVVYPLIPWIGVMAAGYAFGVVYQWDSARRRRFQLAIGGAATALFVILRLVNIYGDSARWSRQSTAAFTVLSFLNTTKYPPSLLFLLMTLGPSLLLLAWFESSSSKSAVESASPALFDRVRNVFVTFGRAPLFFYILQWYTAHFISVAVHLIGGRSVGWMFSGQAGIGSAPPDAGFSLPVVYLCWIIGVVLLYPLCKWFAGVKARRRDWWLSYL